MGLWIDSLEEERRLCVGRKVCTTAGWPEVLARYSRRKVYIGDINLRVISRCIYKDTKLDKIT